MSTQAENDSSSTMQRFSVGDQVEVALTDPEGIESKYNRQRGRIVDVVEDDLGDITGNPRDSYYYKVALLTGSVFYGRDSDLNHVAAE